VISGLDSATPPTPAQAREARAAGVGLWSGYIATKANVNLLNPWKREEFQAVQQVFGTPPVAFCSGWDDPAAVRALAASWGVRHCLDVEDGIRSDGSWVQPWLDASGAGLYGHQSVFTGRRAPFFIMSGYPGHDPGSTWAGMPPPVPHGWQWLGTHVEFGVAVDGGWYDEWFGPDPPPKRAPTVLLEESAMFLVIRPEDTPTGLPFVIPDLFEAASDPNSDIRASWVGVCAQDVDTVVDVMAWRQDGSWIGDTGDHTLKAPVSGTSGPTTLAVNAFTQWGFKGAYTLGIVIRSGGRIHVGYHMQ
jgi:hypothetical protein